MTDEEREHLERDFYSYIMRRMPNISDYWYGNLMDAFQRGCAKGEAVLFNKISDIKLQVYDDEPL